MERHYQSHREWEAQVSGRPLATREKKVSVRKQREAWGHPQRRERPEIDNEWTSGLESRLMARAAGEARVFFAERLEPIEARMESRVESIKRNCHEVTQRVAEIEIEVCAQKKNNNCNRELYAATQMATDMMRHEMERSRARIAKMEAERGDWEAWRLRQENEMAQLRCVVDEARKAKDELQSQLRSLKNLVFGQESSTGDGGIMAGVQLQAHAAVAAAMAPFQAHQERELASVRRHVAALRAGASYASMQEEDVAQALEAARPSELALKGLVASAVSDTEERLESRVRGVLEAKFSMALESKATQIRRDAEEAVFARVQGTQLTARVLMREDDIFKREESAQNEVSANIDDELVEKLDVLSKKVDGLVKKGIQKENYFNAEIVACKEKILGSQEEEQSRLEALEKTQRQLRELVESGEVARRKRSEKERGETESKLRSLRDELAMDMAELRRRDAKSQSAVLALEERLGLVRDAATNAAEEAPGVRRAAQASARLDALERQTVRLEAKLGPNGIECSLDAAKNVSRGLTRRLESLEQWANADTDGAASKLRRVAAILDEHQSDNKEFSCRLKKLEAAHEPLLLIADNVSAMKVALDTARDDLSSLESNLKHSRSALESRSLQHQRSLESAREHFESRIVTFNTRVDSLESKIVIVDGVKRRVDEIESASTDTSRDVAKAQSEASRATSVCQQFESIARDADSRARQCAIDLLNLVRRLDATSPKIVTPAAAASVNSSSTKRTFSAAPDRKWQPSSRTFKELPDSCSNDDNDDSCRPDLPYSKAEHQAPVKNIPIFKKKEEDTSFDCASERTMSDNGEVEEIHQMSRISYSEECDGDEEEEKEEEEEDDDDDDDDDGGGDDDVDASVDLESEQSVSNIEEDEVPQEVQGISQKDLDENDGDASFDSESNGTASDIEEVEVSQEEPRAFQREMRDDDGDASFDRESEHTASDTGMVEQFARVPSSQGNDVSSAFKISESSNLGDNQNNNEDFSEGNDVEELESFDEIDSFQQLSGKEENDSQSLKEEADEDNEKQRVKEKVNINPSRPSLDSKSDASEDNSWDEETEAMDSPGTDQRSESPLNEMKEPMKVEKDDEAVVHTFSRHLEEEKKDEEEIESLQESVEYLEEDDFGDIPEIPMLENDAEGESNAIETISEAEEGDEELRTQNLDADEISSFHQEADARGEDVSDEDDDDLDALLSDTKESEYSSSFPDFRSRLRSRLASSSSTRKPPSTASSSSDEDADDDDDYEDDG